MCALHSQDFSYLWTVLSRDSKGFGSQGCRNASLGWDWKTLEKEEPTLANPANHAHRRRSGVCSPSSRTE
ncbi:hypothetical protein BDDG_12133 [Blastomyces dermatitidis ATCC 18188]|uniref:Uncharacterized protein n=1 Tax=Ajellomyces dermatitidis (strain ATCC 18188 / CBS 674.68) TaxID=653446 RepID=A0A0J9EMZ0_AJEDA|nr:hypothetical protein BDFG_01523 [Blastomyces dermatitidis ATCC 26199]KMW67461.1 hypothetical protein BDDG_12133 [Blastomyces dermatitidis ATCC 18188]